MIDPFATIDVRDPDTWIRMEERIYFAGAADVRRALESPHPGPGDLAALLGPAAIEHIEAIARRAAALTLRRFGRTVVLYAPLYLSNECRNSCAYCGFAHGREIPRRTLTEDEIAGEAECLRAEGFGHVLLLTGEDRHAVPPAYIRRAVEICRRMFSSVAVEVYPLDPDEYTDLVDAGCDGLTLYQETYCQETYGKLHPWGPKAAFRHRLDAPSRGAAAGMRWVSIGALLGLADWRVEALFLAAHGRQLRKRHWRTRLAIGFPRLRNEPGAGVRHRPLADRDLVQMVSALRLALPDADLVLSTRESADLRDAMAGLGITRMSAGSRTSPGGYTLDGPAGEQFEVTDRRTPAEFAAALATRGLEPVWKDWDREFAGR